MEYELNFTIYISSGDGRLSHVIQCDKKNKCLDKIKAIDHIFSYDVYDDGYDWCINCLAVVHSDSFDHADMKMVSILNSHGVTSFWDYNYIKCIDTMEMRIGLKK